MDSYYYPSLLRRSYKLSILYRTRETLPRDLYKIIRDYLIIDFASIYPNSMGSTEIDNTITFSFVLEPEYLQPMGTCYINRIKHLL